jgi:Bacterial SH3 domain
MRRLLALCALCAGLCATAAARAPLPQSPAAKSRITTASGVRVRQEPRTAAAEVARLPLGVVVRELERSAQKERVGAAEDYWFRVGAPNGAEGWVFGGLTAGYDADQRDEIYKQLAASRLANETATFAELSDLVVFLERAVKEVTRPEALAELELARLLALHRSLASINMMEKDNPPYAQWTAAREGQIVYSDPAGLWFVRAETFWDLQERFKNLPIGERIAWEAARIPLPGECEGYLPCYLYLLTETEGRYLKLYPRGAHAAEALKAVADFFAAVNEDAATPNPVYEVPAEERAEFQKALQGLRAQVAPAEHALREQVLKQLDELARRFR